MLNNHAPRKKKYIRGNNKPFMTKAYSKAIMARTRFRNKFLKNPSEQNKETYNKQRNYCVSLLRKDKKEYFAKLDEKNITDNKKFWHTVKPFLSDKVKTREAIILVDNNDILYKENEVAKTFNNFFSNIVKNLNIPEYQCEDDIHVRLFCNPALQAIMKYRNHPSIKTIGHSMQHSSSFYFSPVAKNTVLKEIEKLNTKKAVQDTDIPVKVLKANADFFAEHITRQFNEGICSSKFAESFKFANVTPVFKQGSKNLKDNYRPISILPNISKIFEHCLHDQLSAFFDDILSPQQCGFRKGYNAQYCLIALVEKCKHALDKRGKFGALLTDLSKAFDCLPHDLLIAKLNAYGIEKKSLSLIHSYLSNRKQRVKINSDYSPWGDVKCGVPQGSILGPLLFNVFICDLFMFMPNHTIANYADDNTPYSTGSNMNEVILDLQLSGNILFSWLKNNGMKANTDKSHLLLSQTEKISTQIYDENIINTSCEKLLGVKIDRELKFDEHVKSLCKKANQKLSALTRLSSLMSFNQRKLIMNAFITSHFSYCPQV